MPSIPQFFPDHPAGQLIGLLADLDMVIVTSSCPFFQQHDGKSWEQKKAIINLVGELIDSLPPD